jgi:hypothetical protein
MQSPLRSHVSGWVGVAGAAGVLVSVLMLSGCPGTLDPTQFNTTGTGGSGSGTGGSTGTGGSSGTCTGDNDGATIVANTCATTGCHIPGPLNDGLSGGLDLTVDANIASRLVGVMSVGTAANNSQCMAQTEPYLVAGSNPATGLLIDKIKPTRPCGDQMPAFSPFPLTAAQQTCLIQWATTLTSP